MSDPAGTTGGSAERAFFREEFRRRTVVIAVREHPVVTVVPAVTELLAGDCRVVIIVDGTDASDRPGAREIDLLATALGAAPISMPASSDALAQLWTGLEDTGLRVVGVDGDPALRAAELAVALGVSKLVLTDAAGGLAKSFASLEDLDRTALSRPVVAQAVREALEGRVAGVNVCRAVDLDTELFTFDGAGTLFTIDAYVQVARLGADDLPVVEQLVARGVAEGHLRPRSRAAVVRLALDGLGARVGAQRHLAGFGALETGPYVAEGVAEVTCLYTVNRYVGEGVGGRLVDGLVEAARRSGVSAVFACTASERAAALFERVGFATVPTERLPAAKWVDYDIERRQRITAHWLDLAAVAPPGASDDVP